MKQILLFGAGKSATVLIQYLIKQAEAHEWQVVVVDQDLSLAKSKIGDSTNAKAVSFDIQDQLRRLELIRLADVVISLLPPTLHHLVAQDCIEAGKHLLTASYVDARMLNLRSKIASKRILFLCEMGLDPGIDHMSAMQLVHKIQKAGGRITSFRSHCGGLIAPESDDNPWHYKISWNPRNVVLAGKDGASFRESGTVRQVAYEDLFIADRKVNVPGLNALSWYPNRDSLSYMPIYALEEAATFVRTTLRHPDFMYGWKNVIDLKLTDTTQNYEFAEDIKLADFFKIHFETHGFSEWVQERMIQRFSQTKEMLEKLMQLMQAEEEAAKQGETFPDQLMMVDGKGKLNDIHVDEVKENAAAVVAHQMHEANLTLKQLFFLGVDDTQTVIPRGKYSAADVLQIALEKKLALTPEDRDMVVMQHEIEYELNGEKRQVKSYLLVKGENNLHTAMAKTVGLPLGIAAKLILQDKIKVTGLQIPIIPEIYEPVLRELEDEGIVFKEAES
jgi:saccharopine dehydrogenase-like NADP-dependent oxidoreductase